MPIVFLLLQGCSYHMGTGGAFRNVTMNVPYIAGDQEGILTQEVIYQLAASGEIHYQHTEADYRLKIVVSNMEDKKIVYRHDQDEFGRIKKNIMPIGNQISLKAEVFVISAATKEIVFGPKIITADIDYDYVKQDSVEDLSFFLNGQRKTVLEFSLGQLEPQGPAQKAALHALYRTLAKKIVQMILQKDSSCF